MTSLLIKLFVKDSDKVHEPSVRKRYGILATTVGIILNLLLFAGKLTIGIIAMSVSVIADAFNNITDASSSVVTLVGFRLAEKRADKDHPLGHGRLEYISALIVDMLIILVGFEFLKSSVEKIITPQQTATSSAVLVLLGVAVLVKLWLFFFYKRIGKAINSSAIRGVAFDSISDAFATTVVFVSALIGKFSDIQLDGWAGVIVACMILFTGLKVTKETIDLLLGKSPDKKFVEQIYEFVKRYSDVVNIHDVMVHDYGPSRQIITFHAEVPSGTDFCYAHDIADRVERDMQAEFGYMVTIHLDPVVINDQRFDHLKQLALDAVAKVDSSFTIHDFRIIESGKHTNLIFDLTIPTDSKISPEQVGKEVSTIISNENKDYVAIINVEYPFV